LEVEAKERSTCMEGKGEKGGKHKPDRKAGREQHVKATDYRKKQHITLKYRPSGKKTVIHGK